MRVTRIMDRDRAINGLTNLRLEWQAASGGLPLAEIAAPVGLVLADVCTALSLMPEEAEAVLDGEGFKEPSPIVLLDLAEL